MICCYSLCLFLFSFLVVSALDVLCRCQLKTYDSVPHWKERETEREDMEREAKQSKAYRSGGMEKRRWRWGEWGNDVPAFCLLPPLPLLHQSVTDIINDCVCSNLQDCSVLVSYLWYAYLKKYIWWLWMMMMMMTSVVYDCVAWNCCCCCRCWEGDGGTDVHKWNRIEWNGGWVAVC